jgi:hypothetical protein
MYKIILHSLDYLFKTELVKEYNIKKLEKDIEKTKDYLYSLRKTINKIDIDLADYTESMMYQKEKYLQEERYISEELEIMKNKLIGKKEDFYKQTIKDITKNGEEKYYRQAQLRKAEAHSRQIDFSMTDIIGNKNINKSKGGK